MRKRSATAVVVVASLAALVPGVVVEAATPAAAVVSWADLRADLEAVSEAAGRGVALVQAAGRELPRAVADSVTEIERALLALDGADSAGAAATAWRTIFGSGASVLATSRTGVPVTLMRFPDPQVGLRFLRRRLGEARTLLQGRSGPARNGAALHSRMRKVVAGLTAGNDPPRSGDGGCGPVRVEAAGDTEGLGQICADLEAYWPHITPRPDAPVLRLHPVRTGTTPRAERRTTAVLSAVEPLFADLAAATGPARPGVEEAAMAQPRTEADYSRPAPRDRDLASGSAPPRAAAAPAAPGSQNVPGGEAPPGVPALEQSAATSGGTDQRRPSAWAPLLAAAGEPGTWGGVAALVVGAWLFGRGRELRRRAAGGRTRTRTRTRQAS